MSVNRKVVKYVINQGIFLKIYTKVSKKDLNEVDCSI